MQDENDWLAVAAARLGVDALDEEETVALLDLARDVAHNTERRYAPLTCFLVGLAAAEDRATIVEVAGRLADEARSPGPEAT